MNRTGTYVASDGQGSTDPTESNIHYFNLLKAWNKSGSIDFRFTNSREKTYQVRGSSSKATLFNRLETRLSARKNFLLIISDNINYDRGIFNWGIEKTVDYYELPIIIAYLARNIQILQALVRDVGSSLMIRAVHTSDFFYL